ncbi:hypothetical protein GALMADRAFT_236672 [Galerina marginata CBS 339.88]|uniref:Uncharacterized protein n=1 Tax=Galerina marginata (strain CBS 339.88) TaxID=685588 RepID=A0A067TLN4_GALM3|nr:hypothetical protein GALMADRAFT_236672 [Galerina marginata CBS 339.88]
MGQIFSSNPPRNDTVIIVIRPTGSSTIIDSATRSGSLEIANGLSTVSRGEIRHRDRHRVVFVDTQASPDLEETQEEQEQRTNMQRRLDNLVVNVQSLRSEISTIRVGAVEVDGGQIWTEMQKALDKVGHQIQRLRFDLVVIRAWSQWTATWARMQEQLDNVARDVQRARSELAVKRSRSGPEVETDVSEEENMEEDDKGPEEVPTSKSLKVDESQFVHKHGGSRPGPQKEGPPQSPQPLPHGHLYPPYPPYFYPGYHVSPYHLAPPMAPQHCGISFKNISRSAITIGEGESSNTFLLNSDEQHILSGQPGSIGANE